MGKRKGGLTSIGGQFNWRLIEMQESPAYRVIGGQFNWRLIEMQESPAYRVLNTSEHRCLSRLEIELAHHGGRDNGALPVTFDDFERYGVHRHSIAPALRALVALGFIKVTREGRAGNAEWRRPAEYLLTYRETGKRSEHDRSDAWRHMETMAEAKAIAKAARNPPCEKQKPSGGNRTKGQCGNRTTTRPIHSYRTATTAHGDETVTTSIFRGGGGGCGGRFAESKAEGELRAFAEVADGVVVRHGVRSARLGSRASGSGLRQMRSGKLPVRPNEHEQVSAKVGGDEVHDHERAAGKPGDTVYARATDYAVLQLQSLYPLILPSPPP